MQLVLTLIVRMVIALLVSLLAGLATSIGGYLATHPKILERSVLAISLSFSAGAMIFVGLVEMLPLGAKSLGPSLANLAAAAVLASFFGGMILVALIDRFLPSGLNPSHIEGREDALQLAETHDNSKLLRSGVLVAVVLALHNFPEGMSTFFATYQDLSIGLALAIAIAIHNIPEGVAVAAPIYAATKNRQKAFWWATFSGVAEPIGAVAAALLISFIIPEAMFGLLFGLVAGMMVYLSFDELLPAARRYASSTHQVIYSCAAGMAVVGTSLQLFNLSS